MAPSRARKPVSSAHLNSIISDLWSKYSSETPPQLLLVDAFLAFYVCTGISLFIYCLLITSYPFNAFLASFSSCVGQFVLLASLRIQANPENSANFRSISPERAFAEFTFTSVILHLFVFNFLG